MSTTSLASPTASEPDLRTPAAVRVLYALAIMLSLWAPAAHAACQPYLSQWGMQGNAPGQFNGPFGITVGPDRRVYVADSFNSRVQVFNAAGQYLSTIGGLGTGPGQFDLPYDVAVDASNHAYVLDYSLGRIQEFDANGAFVRQVGQFGPENRYFNYPQAIALDSTGYIYVADSGNHRIVKLDHSGAVVSTFGSYGQGPGEFWTAWGVAVDDSGFIYVSDFFRVQKFNAAGAFLTQWNSASTPTDWISGAYGLTVGPDGYVYVSESASNRVVQYDRNGRFVCMWGTQGTGNGQFQGAIDVAFDPDGVAYVLEEIGNRVQKFAPHVIQPTTLALGSSVNPGLAGSSVTLTARVQPSAASGLVDFRVNGTLVGSTALANGMAIRNYTLPTSGPVGLTATYQGNADYASSVGTLTQQVIARTPVTLTLSTSRSPELVSHSVTFTATTSPSAPGSITFMNGALLLGSAPLVGGVATLAWTLPATPTSLTITASFAGDSARLPATASIPQEVVTRYPTSVALISSANPSPTLSVTLTANVTPATATGSMTFTDDAGLNAVVSLVNGSATYAYTVANFGVRIVTASYSGDATHATSVKSISQTFAGVATLTQVSGSQNPSTINTPVLLTAQVEPAAATGTVRFEDAGVLLGVSAVTGGAAILSFQSATAGDHAITAKYSGDSHFHPSSGTFVLQLFDGSLTATTLSPSSILMGLGDRVAYTAVTTPAPDSGGVAFYVDGSLVGSIVPVSGVARLESLAPPTPGAHTVSAAFTGSRHFVASASGNVTVYVTAYSPDVLHVLWPNGGEHLVLGVPVTLQWDAGSNGTVPFVALYVSRTSPVPEWEVIDAHVPNTGSMNWTPMLPESYTARFMVVDLTGEIGADASDLDCAILDALTPAAIADFTAEASEAGVVLTWQAASGASATPLQLERAPASAGPWQTVAAIPRVVGERATVEDRDVGDGLEYWYRLRGTSVSGNSVSYGPISVVMGAPRAFSLGTPWPNPARANVSVSLAVPRFAHLRVSVLDVAGREVAQIADGNYRAGRYVLTWNNTGARAPVRSGVYFIRCSTPDKDLFARVAIVR